MEKMYRELKHIASCFFQFMLIFIICGLVILGYCSQVCATESTISGFNYFPTCSIHIGLLFFLIGVFPAFAFCYNVLFVFLKTITQQLRLPLPAGPDLCWVLNPIENESSVNLLKLQDEMSHKWFCFMRSPTSWFTLRIKTITLYSMSCLKPHTIAHGSEAQAACLPRNKSIHIL